MSGKKKEKKALRNISVQSLVHKNQEPFSPVEKETFSIA